MNEVVYGISEFSSLRKFLKDERKLDGRERHGGKTSNL